MSKELFLPIALLASQPINAQSIHFTYDDSGNRISRELVTSNLMRAMMGLKDENDNVATNIFPTKRNFAYGFDGERLSVSFDDDAIRVVSLYTPAGQLAMSQETSGSTVSFDTSSISGKVYLLVIKENRTNPQVFRIIKR